MRHFGQGDKAFSGLQEFAEKYQIPSSHFHRYNALDGATLASFDPERKMYRSIPVHGQVEVVSMIGDIALYQGKPTVHTHLVVGTRWNDEGPTCPGRTRICDN